MPPRMINDLERIRYRSGQALASRDLQDDQDFGALYRWLHHRYLHGALGIASGLEVEDRANQAARVLPGVAYDGYGREIVLSRPVEVRYPDLKVGESRDLVIHYKENKEFPYRSETLESCLPGQNGAQDKPGFSALQEQPIFLWRKPGMAHFGKEIPLVRASLIAIARFDLDPTGRQNSVTLTRPHIGYGEALIDPASLIPWSEDVGQDEPSFVGAQVEIDTTSAGFTQTPCYVHMAKLQVQAGQSVRLVLPIQILLPFPAFESIAYPQSDRFTYRIIVPSSSEAFLASLRGRSFRTGRALVPLFVARTLRAQVKEVALKISVSWFGVESGPEDISHLSEPGV